MSTADLLLHPVRLRIVQTLVGRPMTPLALKEALGDVPQATVYRQLNRLVEGGLVDVIGERPVRGGTERTYAVVEEAVRLGGEELAGAGPDDHLRFFTTFVGSLLSGYGRYLDMPEIDLEADGAGYRQTPMWLTDDEFDDFIEGLGDLLERGYRNDAAPGRRRRLVTTVIFPDVEGQ